MSENTVSTPAIPSTFEQLVQRERQYLVQTYARYPLALVKGKGVYLWDTEGRKYLDLVGGLGVNALGHAHPRIVKVIREQSARVIHLSNLYYNEFQGVLAERLVQISGLDRAFFSNSGTEAMEGALKLARLAGHHVGGEAKARIVALEGSFHGRTFGAMSITGQEKYRKGFEPLLEPVRFVPLNDVSAIREAVTDETCAIVLETIQGEGGIRECSTEFLQAAREAADRHKAALILDEIQCGLGRTGRFFAYQDAGITPDIVTMAKPIAAGLPLGAFVARESFAREIATGKHGTTFGGGPLTCRVALEYLTVIEDEGLLAQVQRVGAYMAEEFRNLRKQFDIVVETRGRGMIQAIELSVPARPIVDLAMQEGVLMNVTQEKVLRFLPAFLLEEKHVDKAVKVLKKGLKAAAKAKK
jgi:predicted acetylornithine/succinylornithine family transaminase